MNWVGKSRQFCRSVAAVGLFLALFCQCQRKTPEASPTPEPSPSPAASPELSRSESPSPTPTPSSTPEATPSPTPSAASPAPTATPDPQSLEEGMKRILAASDNGFLDLRGKFRRAENGNSPSPLFRTRRLYEGTFLCAGAVSAELEEVYYRKSSDPNYNYRLLFQSLSAKASTERYDDLMVRLQQLLTGFQHTKAGGYDAWTRSDAAGTAVLLSVMEQPGLLQIQTHVTFRASKW